MPFLWSFDEIVKMFLLGRDWQRKIQDLWRRYLWNFV